MRWREERGSSSILLIGVWTLLMTFLAFSFDFARYYVYRQRLQTRVEAAAAAGAMKPQYRLTISVGGQRARWEWTDKCLKIDKVTGSCLESVKERRLWNYGGYTTALVGTDWERNIWRPLVWPPGQALSLSSRFPSLCAPTGEPGLRCYDLVVDNCRLESDGDDVYTTMLQAYRANELNGDLVGVNYLLTPRTNNGNPRVWTSHAYVQATMPTIFLQMLGLGDIPIRAEATAKYHRRSSLPGNGQC